MTAVFQEVFVSVGDAHGNRSDPQKIKNKSARTASRIEGVTEWAGLVARNVSVIG